MSSYDRIAKLYDTVVAPPTEKATWLKQLIETYRPDSKDVLELACGTGNILKVLEPTFNVVGLDNSTGMLAVARNKLPNTTFIQADMSDFDIRQTFDVILCIYDSINHLILFSEWESMFKHVAQHLNPKGLFIFDMNTVEFLQSLNKSAASVSQYGSNNMTIKAIPNLEAITILQIHITQPQTDGSSQSYKTDIPETSFPLPEIERLLMNHFTILKRLGEQRFTEWSKADNKIVYVCRLK